MYERIRRWDGSAAHARTLLSGMSLFEKLFDRFRNSCFEIIMQVLHPGIRN